MINEIYMIKIFSKILVNLVNPVNKNVPGNFEMFQGYIYLAETKVFLLNLFLFILNNPVNPVLVHS